MAPPKKLKTCPKKKRQRGGNFKGKKHQRGGNFKGGKHQRGTKKQSGGGAGLALAAGMAIPAVLGAVTKILPGIFGKKKAAPVTNHNYGGKQQQQQQQQYRQQQYRPQYQPQYQPQYRPQYRPQYQPPPPHYYYQSRQRPSVRGQRGGAFISRPKKIKKYL
jgi:hypothetical protein